jgi:hypothetical protein
MLAASLVTSPGIAVRRMEDLSTLLAKPATNVGNQATCKNHSLAKFVISLLTRQVLATALRRLPTATSLVMLLIFALPQLHPLLLSHRSLWDHHCLIGLDELSIDEVELVIDFLTCNWK